MLLVLHRGSVCVCVCVAMRRDTTVSLDDEIEHLEVLQRLLKEYRVAWKGASSEERELLASIQAHLDKMDRLRTAGSEFADEFHFYWKAVRDLLLKVTGEHRAVVLYLKTLLPRHVGEKPFEVHSNIAACLASIDLKKPVSTLYNEVTTVPAPDWIPLGLPDPGFFMVPVYGTLTVYHKCFQ